MKQRTRIYYTETDKALMWDRWRQGESLNKIARLFDRNHSAIGGILSEDRWHPSVATASMYQGAGLGRTRGDLARCDGRAVGAGMARALRRAPSTVSREICRNGGRAAYRASTADRSAWDRAQRPKRCKLAQNRALARTVAEKLRLQWSPYQVAGWLKRTYPQDETRQVSHETIYRTLFIQARGALKKELLQHLRRTRGMRRSRHHTQKTPEHGRITETVSISERPAEAEDRAVPGHWEGDLFFGSHNSQIATLVERQTRYVMLVKVAGKDSETVINALIKQARTLPRELYKSLTWDRGSEMAEHRRFSLATDIKVYFCDPQQPWQRGSNENTNGLLRQYFPKGTDLSDISQTKLNAIARRLNERPRQTLGFETPAERFGKCVASIS